MANLFGIQTYDDRWVSITIDEFRAFIGLLILSGAVKSQTEDYTYLWDDNWGRPMFRATMPLCRFKSIQKCLRFDNRNDRQERRIRDKFMISGISDLFMISGIII